jgi:hypothetical protein
MRPGQPRLTARRILFALPLGQLLKRGQALDH